MKNIAVDLTVYTTILLLVVLFPSEMSVFVGIGLVYAILVFTDSIRKLRKLFR